MVCECVQNYKINSNLEILHSKLFNNAILTMQFVCKLQLGSINS